MTLPITRRTLLRIGTCAGGFALCCTFTASGHGQGAPGGRINAWVRIGVDDTITVRVAHTEMGQCIHTLAVNLVAEELEVDPNKLQIEAAPVAPEYDTPGYGVMITGDSSSTVTSFDPLRLAGASARIMLVAAASERWHCAVQDCEALGGRIRSRVTGAVLSYGAVAEAAAKLTPPREVKLKPASEWRILGRPIRRVEGRDKVLGTAQFGIDVQLPDVLFGTVLNCPVPGGRLRRIDAEPAARAPGVVKVIPLDNAVIVVAKSFWAASQAIGTLSVDWDAGPGASLNSAGISQGLDVALARPGILVKERKKAPPRLAECTRGSICALKCRCWRMPHSSRRPHRCRSVRTVSMSGHPPRCRQWRARFSRRTSEWLWTESESIRLSPAAALGASSRSTICARPRLLPGRSTGR
jgi:isoquinoline 1-oxidoreductase subunit beta